uniref:Ig-like domain-containing protein n=1 Tax=Echeneis naucrates TaxID=173247 RepID=A0A665VIK4_ECHNA
NQGCFVSNFTSAQTVALKSSSSVHQESVSVSAKVGGNVTLPCSVSDSPWLLWYKQTLGQKPRLISDFYVYDAKSTFYEEFKLNPRFKLDTKNGKNHLTISDLRISDSATYHCAKNKLAGFEIFASIVVNVKASGLEVHQSGSLTIQTGDSVALNCIVQTGICDGEHSVYWFKDSEESRPGVISTRGGKNNTCVREPDTQINACVYSVPITDWNTSSAGTYYCAVASCGRVLFGNRTKLKIEDKAGSLVLIYFLSGALSITTIVVVLLAFLVYKTNKLRSHQSPEFQGRFGAPFTANNEGIQDADSLHYAAVRGSLPNRSNKQRENKKSECVYSHVVDSATLNKN